MLSTINGKTAELIEIKKVREEVNNLSVSVSQLEHNVDASLELPPTVESPDSGSNRPVMISFLSYKSRGAGMESLIESPEISILDSSGNPITNSANGTGGAVLVDSLPMTSSEEGVYTFILDIDNSSGTPNLLLGSYSVTVRGNYGTVQDPIIEVFTKMFEVVELSGVAQGLDNILQKIEDYKALRSVISNVSLKPFVSNSSKLTSSGSVSGVSGMSSTDQYTIITMYEVTLPEESSFLSSTVQDNTVTYNLEWESQISSGLGLTKWAISPDGTIASAVDITDEVVSDTTKVNHIRSGSIKNGLHTSNWFLMLLGKSDVDGDIITAKSLSKCSIDFVCNTDIV